MRLLFGRGKLPVFERIVNDADLAARCAVEKSRAARTTARLSMVEFRISPCAVAKSGLLERLVEFFERYSRQTDMICSTRMERIVVVCPDTDLDGAMAMLARLARQLETEFRQVELAVLSSDAVSEHTDDESFRAPATCSGESSVLSMVHCGIQVRPAQDRQHSGVSGAGQTALNA